MTATRTRTDRASIDAAAVVEMHTQGQRLRTISAALGCGPMLVAGILQEQGVVMRRPGKPSGPGKSGKPPRIGTDSKPEPDAKPAPLEIWERRDYADIKAAVARGVSASHLAAQFRLTLKVAVETVGND